MKLKEKTQEAFDVIKAHGGRMNTADLAKELGVLPSSVTGRLNSLVKNELAYREKVDEGGEKPVTYICLTDAGMNFVSSDDEE